MGDVLKLYVFDGADIKKCYQCNAYDVRLATVEDVAQALRVDRMDAVSRDEIRKAAARCPGKIHAALLDMYDGLTAGEAVECRRCVPGTAYVVLCGAEKRGICRKTGGAGAGTG